MFENGFESGARNFGRMCLSAMPMFLGIGASVWLGVYVGVANYKHDIEQQRRASIYVGAEEKPKNKVKIEVLTKNCLRITKADLNGDNIFIYTKNECSHRIRYNEWHWEAISPNGTILASDYTNQCPKPTIPGDKAECKMNLSTDDRIETLRLKVMSSFED